MAHNLVTQEEFDALIDNAWKVRSRVIAKGKTHYNLSKVGKVQTVMIKEENEESR